MASYQLILGTVCHLTCHRFILRPVCHFTFDHLPTYHLTSLPPYPWPTYPVTSLPPYLWPVTNLSYDQFTTLHTGQFILPHQPCLPWDQFTTLHTRPFTTSPWDHLTTKPWYHCTTFNTHFDWPNDVYQNRLSLLSSPLIRYQFIKTLASILFLYEPRHDKTNKMSVRPVKTQISIHPVWSESSLSAWRTLGFLATH